MKKLYVKLLLINLCACSVILIGQYIHKRAIVNRWMIHDATEKARSVIDNITKSETMHCQKYMDAMLSKLKPLLTAANLNELESILSADTQLHTDSTGLADAAIPTLFVITPEHRVILKPAHAKTWQAVLDLHADEILSSVKTPCYMSFPDYTKADSGIVLAAAPVSSAKRTIAVAGVVLPENSWFNRTLEGFHFPNMWLIMTNHGQSMIEPNTNTARIRAILEKTVFQRWHESLTVDQGERFLLLSRPLAIGSGSLILIFNIHAFYHNIEYGANYLFILNALTVVILLFVLLLLHKHTVLNPIHQIAQNVEHIFLGGDSQKLPYRTLTFKEIRGIQQYITTIFSQFNNNLTALSNFSMYSQTILRSMQVAVIVLNREFTPLFLNDYAQRLFNLSEADVATFSLKNFFNNHDWHILAGAFQQSGMITNQEAQIATPSGQALQVDISITCFGTDTTPLRGHILLLSDSSKRKLAEKQLQQHIVFSEKIFQAIPEMILITDSDLRINFANNQAQQTIPQLNGGSFSGTTITQLLTAQAQEKGVDEMIREAIATGQKRHETNIQNPFQTGAHYVDLMIEPISDQIHGCILLLRDITEWRHLTDRLHSLQEFLQKLIDASPYTLISLNSAHHITAWNVAAERMFQIAGSSVYGKEIYQVQPLFLTYQSIIDDVLALKKTFFLGDEKIFVGDDDFIIANITLYPVSADEQGVVIHIEDISQVKQMEHTLQQAQKMESLGVFTSSIIHDFNNILSGILGYASLLEQNVKHDPQLSKYISTIIMSSERATTMINQIMNFSRKKMAGKELVDLHEIISETLNFISIHTKQINIQFAPAPEPIWLHVDKTKISQIIINLIINAKEALTNIKEPTITIRTSQLHLQGQSKILPGTYVKLEIEDNGCGISKEKLPHIFESFFTTKTKDHKGMGLGLSITKSIVDDYHGLIDVQSEPDCNTIFSIYFPAAEKKPNAPAQRDRNQPLATMSGTALLIDDEDVVREIGADMLKAIGFTCHTAENGHAGLDFFKSHAPSIDLVILDIEMPGISGDIVFEQLRELNPTLPILVASGYSKEYLETQVFKRKIEHFIAKPFRLEQLSYQVHKLTQKRHV